MKYVEWSPGVLCLLMTAIILNIDLIMKRSVSSFHFSEKRMFLIILLLATSTVPIPLGLNNNQSAIAQQQQKQQGLENNQTSSSSLTKQQPNGISFQIDNMTFSHNTASVNDINCTTL
jgi:hypothetical protein